ncbi:uncharacterized protein LOC114529077 isoform X2 [Dendronephthya gigantea]|uniref:uncharacterized protein LOC114529077 isoform X2 n=1 Tax=Dendronephthya gigantea TaxID=151771 RepID=UPI00106AA879|nr:uncharacterized protein LOC114529077 isoform X2 [Dendronephthya gigantea]
MSAVSFKLEGRTTAKSRDSYTLTPDSIVTRPRTFSQFTQGRRQRKVSQINRKVSQSAMARKRRESRYTMRSSSSNVSHDPYLDAVKELVTNAEPQGHQNEKAKAEMTKHTVFTEYLKGEDQEKETLNSDLYFDLSYFKANRKMYVSAETKHVLSSPSNARTEQQIAKVKYWLSYIQSFSEYPRRMQQKLIQVGWYECHAAKRVLIRQGHRPQAFYFLLSGSAVVTVMDKKTQISRTVHFLKRGDSFGELAILHDTVRQSTIITREFSELLVISKEDFIEIFMASRGVKTITDPDHVEFIRNINFLKEWPIELLSVNPKRCLFHFFRRGAVLVKDSNRSDWIYVVKSGSCRVLKKLKKVQSRLTEHQERVVGFERVSSRIAESSDQFTKLRLTISALSAFKPKTGTSTPNPSNHPGNNHGNSALDGHMTQDDVIKEVAKAQVVSPGGGKIPDRWKKESKESLNESMLGRRQSAPATSKLTKESIGLPSVGNGKKTLQSSSSWSKLRSALGSKNNAPAKRRISKASKDTLSQDPEDTLPSNKLSFLDEEDVKKDEKPMTADDQYKPVFVEVASLTKGDTFGVNFMFFDKQPSLSLVSNGVECIVISKKFFLSHCTEAMKRRLLLQEQPYPDDETLQRGLQDKINWESFKTKTLNSTMHNLTQSIRRLSLDT